MFADESDVDILAMYRVSSPIQPSFARLSIAGILCAIVVLSSGPRVSFAQSADAESTERARALFSEGLELADREDWGQASDRFRRSLALRHSPAVRLNLASSLARLGRDGEAADHLEALLDTDGTPANLRELAEELYADIRPRTARIRIEVANAEGPVQISLDGETLPEWRCRGQLRVDPGAHVLAVQHQGVELARHELELEVGGLAEYRIEASQSAEPIADEGDAGTGDPQDDLIPEDPPPPPRRRRWPIAVGVSSGVVVVLAVVLGVVFGVGTGDEEIVEGNMEPGVWRW